jgi:hypothetical protein
VVIVAMVESQKESAQRSKLFARIRSASLFRRDVPVANVRDVIGWWESRRIPFNLIVGSAGLLTCICCGVVLVVASILAPNDSDMGSPLVGLIGILLYGIIANVCYTGGWVAELGIRKLWPHEGDRFGTTSFFLGLLFSVLLTLTPGIVFVAGGLFGLVHHVLRATHRL